MYFSCHLESINNNKSTTLGAQRSHIKFDLLQQIQNFVEQIMLTSFDDEVFELGKPGKHVPDKSLKMVKIVFNIKRRVMNIEMEHLQCNEKVIGDSKTKFFDVEKLRET